MTALSNVLRVIQMGISFLKLLLNTYLTYNLNYKKPYKILLKTTLHLSHLPRILHTPSRVIQLPGFDCHSLSFAVSGVIQRSEREKHGGVPGNLVGLVGILDSATDIAEQMVVVVQVVAPSDADAGRRGRAT